MDGKDQGSLWERTKARFHRAKNWMNRHFVEILLISLLHTVFSHTFDEILEAVLVILKA